MRFVTFSTESGEPHIGVVRDDHIVDLSTWLVRNPVHRGATAIKLVDLIALGDDGLETARFALSSSEEELRQAGALMPLDRAHLLAPVPRPPKNVMCLGRNYSEHAQESARMRGEGTFTPSTYPTFFTKAPTTVAGPYQDLAISFDVSQQIDWEVELAIVIGKAGKNISKEDAAGHIFGYMVLNDITARDVQERHGKQHFKGKSLDNTCPTGPWIVTPDEIGDPNELQIWTRVNGVEKQHGTTADMIFDVPTIIESLSQGMTLEPGDIIATGTPGGIGHARTPAEYLRPGDTVECEVERIGVITNRIRGEAVASQITEKSAD